MYQYSPFDLLPYILLIVFCLTIGSFTAIKNAKNAYVIYILLLLFSSVRYGVGYDYFNYKNLVMLDMPEYNYDRLEAISIVLVRFAKWANSYKLYFFLYSILTLYPIYYVCKKQSLDPALSLLIFLLFPAFYIESLGIIRNFMAFALVFMSYYYYVSGKKKLYIIFVFLAGLSHGSGYLGFLLIIAYHLPSNRYFHISLFLVCFLLGSYIDAILGLFPNIRFVYAINKYLQFAREVGSMKYLMLIMLVVNFVYWRNLGKCDHRNPFLLKIINLGFCLFFLFIKDDTLSFRFSTFFLLFIILLYPSFKFLFKKRYNKIVRYSILCWMLCLCAVSFYLNISGYLEGRSIRINMFPYQTIFYNEQYSNYY